MTGSAVSELANITARIMNPIIESTNEMFETMLGCSATRTEFGLKTKSVHFHPVTAVIGMAGIVTGSICVSMPRRTAFGSVYRLLDERVSEVDGLVRDTVGEFANVIGGAAKMRLSDIELELGLPTVVSGGDYEVDFPSSSQPMFVNFNSEIGPFTIVFGFAK